MIENLTQLRHTLTGSLDTLTSKHRLLAEHVLARPEDVAVATVKDLSMELAMNPATIVRFSQALGFSGFPALRAVCRESITQTQAKSGHANDLSSPRSTPSSAIARVLDAQESALRRLYALNSEDALHAVARKLWRAPALYVCGLGTGFVPAQALAHQLDLMRPRVTYCSGLGGMGVPSLRHVQAGDGVVFFEQGLAANPSDGWVQLAEQRKAMRLAITDNNGSVVARSSEMILRLPVSDSGFVAYALVDTLVALMRRKFGAVEAPL